MKWKALALVFVALSGCGAPSLRKPPWPEPVPLARPAAPPRPAYQSTSLWAEGTSLAALYGDPRARNVGDLVTVVVVEASEASREASTDVSRDTTVAADASGILGMPSHMGLKNLYGSQGFDPSVKAQSANSFKGEGTTKRKDVLRTRVAARVVEVLEDGNLLLEGRRQVKVNEDDQFLFVRGIARPVDISPENTISSIALAEAQILYGGSGDIAAHQRPGWLYRAINAVWPF
ncbi:MAG: flagellar basal body L-ring protein FlgH [Deltaproteobacteria bacterium]|nr:flagellar basal body L-ring protein FlgH [Deltaproteobacteria bacterium]